MRLAPSLGIRVEWLWRWLPTTATHTGCLTAAFRAHSLVILRLPRFRSVEQGDRMALCPLPPAQGGRVIHHSTSFLLLKAQECPMPRAPWTPGYSAGNWWREEDVSPGSVHPGPKVLPLPLQLPAQQHQSLTLSGKLQSACVIALHLIYSFFEFLKNHGKKISMAPCPPHCGSLIMYVLTA